MTAVAPTVGVLALGWSFLEGIGAALVLPAMAALIAGNFEGSARKAAYAVIGGVAGAGIAVGPIVGGWATTELSWRVVFAGEVVLVAFHSPDDTLHRGRAPQRRQAAARRRGDACCQRAVSVSSCSVCSSRARGGG